MEKYEFMCIVDDILDECNTKAEMDMRVKQMREIIQQEYMLKIGFKSTMGELKQTILSKRSCDMYFGLDGRMVQRRMYIEEENNQQMKPTFY